MVLSVENTAISRVLGITTLCVTLTYCALSRRVENVMTNRVLGVENVVKSIGG